MPLKAVPAVNVLVATVTISGPLGTQSNTSMAKLSKQLIKQYKKMITQPINN